MKKNFKYLALSLILTGSLISCDEDGYDRDVVDVGGYASLKDKSLSVFDTNEDLNIDLFTNDGVSVETVEIYKGDSMLGEATINENSASFNSSILGDFAFGEDNDPTGSFSIFIKSYFSNGEFSEDPFSISVDKAVEISEDNKSKTTLDSLDVLSLAYSVSTFSATVDDVTLMLKKNKAGEYTNSNASDIETEEGTVVLGDTNYDELNLQKNDTLYYKFIATSGELTDEAESYTVVEPKAFDNMYSEVSFSGEADNSQFDFATAEASSSGDIQFVTPAGFTVVEGSNIQFVQIEDDSYETEDLLSTRDLYNAGTKTTSANNLEQGDTFVYKVTRDIDGTETDFYGIMEVQNIIELNGVMSIEFKYSEGML
ncbi:hypothetical protein [Zunongwangia sp.]|uniref:hypothetical protein n=1 Tax=Zunongwangia sp. TaxID=1965325 RepID=UPI003AA839DA